MNSNVHVAIAKAAEASGKTLTNNQQRLSLMLSMTRQLFSRRPKFHQLRESFGEIALAKRAY